MTLRRVLACCIALASAGCAIHPLPDDVTALSTENVVVHVRCEMQAAMRNVFREFLSGSEHNKDPLIQTLIQKIDRGDQLAEGDISNFDKETQSLIDRYKKIGIAYNFTFNITENSNAEITMDFLKAFTGAVGTLIVSAGDRRDRESIRSFTITDTPEKLLIDLDKRHRKVDQNRPDKYCGGFVPYVDFRYPVTGNVGLTEVVRTFVKLSLFDSLGDKDGTIKGPPTMSDELTFTTTLTGSLAPKLALSPVRHGLVDAAVTASAGRTDIHKLIIGLSLPLTSDDPKPSIMGQAHRRGFIQSNLISAQGSEAELNAALAVSQSILRFDLRGSTIIINGN